MARTALDELPRKGAFRLRGLEITRLETFTDAAFAFALTLLVISLEPPTNWSAMETALREIPAFLASATLLMVFWWGHHEWSRRYGLDDGPTVLLSCLLVFTVLIYVVPLRFMFGILFLSIEMFTGIPIGSDSLEVTGPADVNTMFAVYGVGFSAMSSSIALLYAHAWRQRSALELSPSEVFETVSEAGVWLILAAVGVLSTLLGLALPTSFVGVPGFVYMILPIATPLYALRRNRRRTALYGPLPEEG